MRRMCGWRLGVVVIVAVSAAVVGLVPAHAEGGRRVSVDSSLHGEDPLSPDTTLCDQYHLSFNGTDQQPYSGHSKYTGTFTGEGDFCGYLEAIPNSDRSLPFREVDKFTGTVAGCGTGTVVYDVTGTVNPNQPDLSNVALGSSEHWLIRSDSATDGLVGISGSGTDPARVNLLPTVTASYVPSDMAHAVTTSVDATFLGSVRCMPAD